MGHNSGNIACFNYKRRAVPMHPQCFLSQNVIQISVLEQYTDRFLPLVAITITVAKPETAYGIRVGEHWGCHADMHSTAHLTIDTIRNEKYSIALKKADIKVSLIYRTKTETETSPPPLSNLR